MIRAHVEVGKNIKIVMENSKITVFQRGGYDGFNGSKARIR